MKSFLLAARGKNCNGRFIVRTNAMLFGADATAVATPSVRERRFLDGASWECSKNALKQGMFEGVWIGRRVVTACVTGFVTSFIPSLMTSGRNALI